MSNPILKDLLSDGKAVVKAALESVENEIVRPRIEDCLLKETVELAERITTVHSNSPEVIESTGRLVKQLVIAQGISAETVSQEGLFDLITKVKNALTGRDSKGIKPSDRKPGQKLAEDREYTKEGRAAIKALQEALDKFYLNDKWLSNQTLINGDIKANDFSSALIMDNKIGTDPLSNIETAKKRIEAWSGKWYPIVKKFHDQIRMIDETVKNETKGAKPDDKEAIKKVHEAIVAFNNLRLPTEDFPKFEGTSTGNLIVAVDKHGYVNSTVTTTPISVDTLPALNKEQIKRAAEYIKLFYSNDKSFIKEMPWLKWIDHSDGSSFNDFLYDIEDDSAEKYYTYDHHAGDRMFIEGVWDLFDEYSVAKALEKWIDRSIA